MPFKSPYVSDAPKMKSWDRLVTPNDVAYQLLKDKILEEVKFNCGEASNALKSVQTSA